MTFDGATFLNPLYDEVVVSGRFDFIPSDRVVNIMNAKNDPRRAVWFLPLSGTTDKYVGASLELLLLQHYRLQRFQYLLVSTQKTGPANFAKLY